MKKKPVKEPPKLEIKYVAPSSLKLNDKNPRINEHAVDPVKGSMEHFQKAALGGFVEPIIARASDNMIVCGHTRVKAALKMNTKEVPVVFVDFDEADAQLYGLGSNKLNELALWDIPGLDAVLEELKALDVDVSIAGFDVDLGDIGGGDGTGIEHLSLAERFGVPPFSVLDARQGYWQARKKAWLALGIQSELGRGAPCMDDGAWQGEHAYNSRANIGLSKGANREREREQWNAQRRSSHKRNSARSREREYFRGDTTERKGDNEAHREILQQKRGGQRSPRILKTGAEPL